MSLPTASWFLWQKEQRSGSWLPFRGFTVAYSPRTSDERRCFRSALLVLEDNIVNDAVFLSPAGGHDEVPLHVLLDAADFLPGVLGQNLIGNRPQPQNLPGVNVNVGG